MRSLQEKLDRVLLRVQKPARYTGGELNSVLKNPAEVAVRFAFCFPDTYEIGMSHLGMKILYSLLNARQDVWCERAFAPWGDFEAEMKREGIPLYALESMDPLSEFDILGFTLQYELSYNNLLQMLSLSGIPLRAAERTGLKNLVIAGGPCACNPEPLADFVDLFVLGEGEEVTSELVDCYIAAREEGLSKADFLRRAAAIPGVYAPSLYEVTYHEDGRVNAVVPRYPDVPARVEKRIVREPDNAYFPDNFIVPFIETVHDRVILELMRGCIRGCRFCQAGFLYRPLREKSPETLIGDCKRLIEATGYEEVSLSSLSTSDYSQIGPLLSGLVDYTDRHAINLTLPSLRIDNFSEELLDKIKSVRKSGLTFAPEAGTQRLRDVINKNITESDVLESCRRAFEGGYTSVKLYFMLGLPTETDEDVAGILSLARRVLDEYYQNPNRPKGRSPGITVSVATFVPKPYTPFQYEPQDTLDEINRKHKLLVASNPSRKITVKYHESKGSVLEAALARGDRRLGRVLLRAFEAGCQFDGWDECFHFDRWEQAFADCGLDMAFYANRRREYDEVFPWSHLDYGVSEAFLRRESEKSRAAQTTPHCREKCAGCGVRFCKLQASGKEPANEDASQPGAF